MATEAITVRCSFHVLLCMQGRNQYKTVIPRSIRLGEAPSFGHTIFEHDPSGTAAEAYLKAAREFIRRHKS